MKNPGILMASLGLEFALTVGALVYGGIWLDERLSKEPTFTLMGVTVGLVLGIYSMFLKIKEASMSKTVFEFQAKRGSEEVSLSQFSGKVLLIVNTASQCGFTPQYNGLQETYNKFHPRGFEILAFPCNQFGGQEPGSDDEIKTFCERTFFTTFPIFSKIDVNGKNADPLFHFLKTEKPGFLGLKDIKWNFTKFLINREGKVVKRYAPSAEPEAIHKDIEALL